MIARAAVALLFVAASLHAQAPAKSDTAATRTRTITGRVLDEQSRGIAGAEVRAEGGASTVTDSAGRFVLRAVPNGPLQFVARKVGYDSVSVTVAAATNDGTPDVPIVLTRAHRLNEIVVEDKLYDRTLWDRGFYHRQKVASGAFFDTDAIDHFGGNGLGSLVQQVPRVDVVHMGSGDYAFSRIAGRPCRMNIYIDGFFQRLAMPGPAATRDGRREEGMGLNELIGFRDIAAVEVYPRASSVPTQFQRMGPPAGPQGVSSHQIGSPNGLTHVASQAENADAACGAIVIWTREPASAK